MQPSSSCKKVDFEINRIQSRVYGSGQNRQTLVYAGIKNKVTGKKFEDWVRPDQLKTRDALCSLIDWGYKDGKKNDVSGSFSCKEATLTVTMNDDGTFNIDGVKYDSGHVMEFNSVPAEFVDEIKKQSRC